MGADFLRIVCVIMEGDLRIIEAYFAGVDVLVRVDGNQDGPNGSVDVVLAVTRAEYLLIKRPNKNV